MILGVMAATSKSDNALVNLKKQIQEVLKSDPKGVEAGSFWNYFIKIHHTLPDPKQFNVSKRSALLELCSDVIRKEGSGHTGHIRLFNIEAPSSTAVDHCAGSRTAQRQADGDPRHTAQSQESAVRLPLRRPVPLCDAGMPGKFHRTAGRGQWPCLPLHHPGRRPEKGVQT